MMRNNLIDDSMTIKPKTCSRCDGALELRPPKPGAYAELVCPGCGPAGLIDKPRSAKLNFAPAKPQPTIAESAKATEMTLRRMDLFHKGPTVLPDPAPAGATQAAKAKRAS